MKGHLSSYDAFIFQLPCSVLTRLLIYKIFIVETCIVVNKIYPVQQYLMAQRIQPESIQFSKYLTSQREQAHKIFDTLTQI